MKVYHEMYNHLGISALNGLIRDGTIADGILLDSISCTRCDSEKMKKTSVSKVHVKKYPMKPFHIVQGDIFDAEDVDSRSNYRYVLVFIDVTTGSAYQYFMVSKDQALGGLKAFESWLAMISPQVEEKWGSPVKLTCVAFDREGSLTTTYGNMQSEADKYFINGGYNRVFTSRGASNGTEKLNVI